MIEAKWPRFLNACVILVLSVWLMRPNALFGCTVFLGARDGSVLVGNNEDYFNAQTKIWFNPASHNSYGHILFGWSNEYDIPMGGMNDKGLVFDWLAVPGFVVNERPEDDPYHRLARAVHHIITTCDSVDSALAHLKTVDRSGRWEAVLFIADGNGDAAVVEGNQIVRKDPSSDYFVATNYRQSVDLPHGFVCPRHQCVTALLTSNRQFNLDLFRKALNATHAESPGTTLYSNIYDPRNLTIRLFHFHDFENGIVLDMQEELGKGKRVEDLPSRFQPNNAATSFAAAAPPDEIPPIVALDRPISNFTGTYGTDAYHIRIQQQGDRMWVYPSIGLRAPLIPVGDDRFITVRLGTRDDYEFLCDRAGGVSTLVLNRNGRTTVLERQ